MVPPAAPPAGHPALEIEHLGLADGRRIDYQWAWDYQREVHARVATGELPARVLLLEHEPVYTAGRQTLPEERPFDGTPVIDVDRGGKITWHGPGQLVGYPIVRLPSRVGVVDHVRRMEQAVIDLLAELGIAAGRVEGRTGVWLPAVPSRPVTTSAAGIWDADPARAERPAPDAAARLIPDGRPAPAVDSAPDHRAVPAAAPSAAPVPPSLRNVIAAPARPERKICAIGIRVARRTTMHGFAVNVTNSTAAFENIIPCGISDAGVTSIAAELGAAPSLPELAAQLTPHLRRCLDYEIPLSDVVRRG